MTDSPEDKGRAFLEEGEVAYQNGDLSKAQVAFEEAAKYFLMANNQRGEAAALTNLGAACAGARWYSKAIEVLESAIALHKVAGNSDGLAMATFSLASALADSGQLFRAKSLFEESMPLLTSTGNESLAARAGKASQWLAGAVPQGLTDEERDRFDRLSAQLKTATESGMTSYHTRNFAVAVRYWNLALQASQALGLDAKSAQLLVYIGSALCSQGHFDDGLKVFESANSLAHDGGYHWAEAAALNGLGCAHLDLGNVDLGIKYLRQAVEIREGLSEPAATAESLGNLGTALARGGDIASAVETLHRALELYETLGDRRSVAIINERIPQIKNGRKYEEVFVFAIPAEAGRADEVYDVVGQLSVAREYESVGDYASAASVHRRLLNVAREAEDKRSEAYFLICIGFTARRRGELSESLISYHQALSAAREAKDRELEARALNNLGVLYSGSDRDAALNFLRAAANLREDLPDKHELGETYFSLSSLSTEDSARNYLEKALSLLNPDQNQYAWATAYSTLKRLLKGADLSDFLKTHLETARRYGAEDLSSRSVEEIELLHEMVPIGEEGGIGLIVQAPKGRLRPPDFGWQLRCTKAESLWIMERHSEAIQELFAAVDEIEKLRGEISVDVQRREYFATQWGVYDTLISYLLTDDRVAEALEVVERAKSRSILEVVGDTDYLPAAVPVEVRKAYRSVRGKLRRAMEELAELQKSAWAEDSEALNSARGEMARGYAALGQITETILRYEPEFSPDSPVHVPDYQRMQSLLRSAQHAFVAYWIGEKACGAFILSQGGVKFFNLPDLESLNASFDEFQATVDALPISRADFEEFLEAFHQQLIAPLKPHIEEINVGELTFIPHYYTHLIPFHVLGASRDTLIEKYVIDYAPSFALYQLSLERRRLGNHSGRALIVANPDGSLENAELEASRVKGILGDAAVLTGSEGTLEALLPEIGLYGILHFACHAQFGEDQGRDIALRLAPTQNHNGLLSLRQIMTNVALDMGCLVVLSACKTGRTVISRSDDFIGLPGGFILAGGAAVIGSLWPVDDVSTALLMQNFYEHLGSGIEHNKALRNAQLWLRELSYEDTERLTSALQEEAARVTADHKLGSEELIDKPFSHPYYWAGFFALGAWAKRPTVT
jgi:CHAT domain-containing protein/tetratricopeptide (TPR) repeat protein